MDSNGYAQVWCPGHPVAMAHGYALEHRHVAWEAGLLTDLVDQIHHINGNKLDNRVSNLRVMSCVAHAGLHNPPAGGVNAEYRRRRVELDERACEVCGKDITALRIDAMVCGNGCRVTRWKRSNRKRLRLTIT